MKRRKFLPDFSHLAIDNGSENKPPLIKADHPVVVCIDPRKEIFEFRLGNYEPCSPKCRLQLVSVQFSIVIPIYTLEKLPKLFLGFFYEGAELCII